MIWDFEKYKDNIALLDGDRTIRYGELDALCKELAEKTEKRSLVFILCRNNLETIAAYAAFLNHGVVPLMLDGKLAADLFASMVELYHPSYLWLPAERSEECGGYEEITRMGSYVLLRVEGRGLKLDEDLALLISTSGSTGSPKLVRLSYRNILANTRSIAEYLSIDEKERAITSLPLNYVYGLSVLNTHLYAGASLVLTDLNCYAKAFWDLFEEKKASSFAGIPFMYEMLHKLRFEKNKVAGLKTMTQAGGKLSPELQDIFAAYAKENGIRFFIMYGASEATARMAYLPPEKLSEKRGSMGIAIPGGRFELLDADRKRIEEPSVTGELVYYGENVSLGYALAPEDLSKGDERQGRLETGDMAYFDEDGYYYVVGRKSRFIKLLGKRLNLAELEGILKKHFDVLDLACSGKDDALEIYVTDEALAGPVRDYLFTELNINRNLCHVAVIAEIPKNAAGKTLYAELKQGG